MAPTQRRRDRDYVAIIDQDAVTDEVRNIAVNYDPLNRSGEEGFHVTEDGELHIDDAKVMAAHTLIQKKIPNDAIEIVPLPAETGQLVHQYGANGFRLYDLPAPEDGSVVGLLGSNGIGKTTALRILTGGLTPNLGDPEHAPDWRSVIRSFRGTAVQTHLERLDSGEITTAFKPQRVESLAAEADATVRDVLAEGDSPVETVGESLGLDHLLDRPVADLSGGEAQLVAIGRTVLTDAELYVFDEPSSFLDAGQRLTVARTIRDHVRDEDTGALVVEHDLATLDLLADTIHVLYGDPGAYGVVSHHLSPREGINQFLDGRLTDENVVIRRTAIEFERPRERTARPTEGDPVFSYPTLRKEFGSFELTVDPGRIHEGELLGIVGANALGKTTFAKMLAGAISPDEGTVSADGAISYKPQYLAAESDVTVRRRFEAVTDVRSTAFETRIREPFDLDPLFDQQVDDLSGGQLQRMATALCLARDADAYLLDEPSAFLDVDRRVSLSQVLRRFAGHTDSPVLVVDHDVFLIDRVADRLIVFDGTSGTRGRASAPRSMRDGMNAFLSALGITFRRDGRTGRPRINDPGSQLDRQQKRDGEYYYER